MFFAISFIIFYFVSVTALYVVGYNIGYDDGLDDLYDTDELGKDGL